MDKNELLKNINILIRSAQLQKEDYKNNSDIRGQYFAAGQISSLELVLKIIESNGLQSIE